MDCAENIPQSIWKYVSANAVQGDVTGIINKIDEFCYDSARRASNVGDVKGQYLDQIVKDCSPTLALELGAYAGYSALRIARAMPENGKLYTIEIDEANAEVTKQMIAFAGLQDKVSVLIGSSGNVIKGSPEFLEYVRNNPKYECTTYMSTLEYSNREDGIEKAVYKI